MINYYEILGIAQNSTAQEIKKSFRKRAKEIHPDVRPDGDERSDEEMRLLLTAYEVLSDLREAGRVRPRPALGPQRPRGSTTASSCVGAPTIR